MLKLAGVSLWLGGMGVTGTILVWHSGRRASLRPGHRIQGAVLAAVGFVSLFLVLVYALLLRR